MNNKILIADDTKTWLLFHTKLIEQLYGGIFEISTASSAIEALNVVKANKTNPFALIITDLQMEQDFEPELAGEWLIKRIKSIREYTYSSIVIISSMPNIELIARKYNVDCISKSMLCANNHLMKYLFEKAMPFLDKIRDIN